MNKNLQRILCVRDDTARTILRNTVKQTVGFRRINPVEFNDILFKMEGQLWIAPRGEAEELDTFRQIIPYIVVKYKDDVIIYRRNNKSGEARLHNVSSLGFGGHIEESDLLYKRTGKNMIINLEDTIFNSIQREMKEELNVVPTIDELSCLGFINLDGNTHGKVNRVHLGFVMLYEPRVKPLLEEVDPGLEKYFTVDIAELKKAEGMFNLEPWSLCVVRLL